MARNIPSDMLEEICSWLPPESLMRFKCVNKTWYALINSLVKNPSFVNKHLRNIDKKILSSTSLLVYLPSIGKHYMSKYPELELKLLNSLTIFHDHNDKDRITCVSKNLDIPTFLLGNLHVHNAILVSHCNGIICLASNPTVVILCNPATKECRTLPIISCSCRHDFLLGIGFGYDSRANDYKIISLWSYISLCEPFERKTRANVYSMGMDSWREIELPSELIRFFPYVEREVFCKGGFYWHIWNDMYEDNPFILYFDMFDEVFHTIPLPDTSIVNKASIKLAVRNDSVALIHNPSFLDVSKPIEVWVMDNCSGGVKVSWIKKLTIGPLVDVAC